MKKALILLIFIINIAYANNLKNHVQIRIAVLDNFRYQTYVTTNYKNYYQKGLQLAIDEANRRGYKIIYKIFPYDQFPLSIFKQIPKVIAWHPDVILGPRDSDKFLLLSNKIKNILTISPFATATTIAKMPSNFFSLTLPDNYTAKAMYYFVKSKYPDKAIHSVIEADCKSCMDVAYHFRKFWQAEMGKIVHETFYIKSQLANITVENSLKNYKRGDIILLPNTAHTSAMLMLKFTNQLHIPITFIGGDGWGAWQDTEVGKFNSLTPYTAFHISPWGLELNNTETKSFIEKYHKKFGHEPIGKLSYIIFKTVCSILSAHEKYESKSKTIYNQNFLAGYQAALKENYFFFKPKNYLVYKIENGKNTFIGTINVISNKLELEEQHES